MCGVAGIVALRPGAAAPTVESLAAMAACLSHRGPDEFGMYRDERAGLAHARLSIIDLATGQQPLCNEDGTLWITYNGEIFNYPDLRAELIVAGHVFRTRSDTEVIVHAYEEWGDDAFVRFNGQFALALWDRRRQQLVLARDRLGVRPMFVAEHAGRVVFASEVKALFAGEPQLERRLDPVGLGQTLTLWASVAPRSVFAGIEELPPGHVWVYEGGRRREHRYYSLDYAPRHGGFRGTLDDATDAVRDALHRACELRMVRADVPVGCYLSGGLDSSLVAALANEYAPGRLSTFSIRFEEAEFDETDHQRTMAKRLGSEHHEVVVRRADIAAAFPAVVAQTERPILRTAPAPLFLLSGLVRDAGIKVVLTGEGADEMFAGYDLFREAQVRRFWARQPDSAMRPRLLERLYPYLARSPVAQQATARQFFGRDLHRSLEPGFGHQPRWQAGEALRRLLSAPMRTTLAGLDVTAELLRAMPQQAGAWTPQATDQFLEITTLLSGYLLSSQGDRMLMAHSVEGRFPFLDVDVVALANSLPDNFKLLGLDEKHVLKRAAAGLVDPDIIRRTKQPYRAPDAVSFTSGDDVPDWVGEVTRPERVAEAGVFDPDVVTRVMSKMRSRRADHPPSNADNMAVVAMLSTQLLHEQLVRTRPTGAPVVFTTVVEPPDAA